MRLYHIDVFMPRNFACQVPVSTINVEYSNHAKNESKRDRYGTIPTPSKIDLSDARLIEVEVEDLIVTKFVVRKTLSNLSDVVYVIRPRRNRSYICVTAWINRKNDKHKTLDVTKYVRGS